MFAFEYRFPIHHFTIFREVNWIGFLPYLHTLILLQLHHTPGTYFPRILPCILYLPQVSRLLVYRKNMYLPHVNMHECSCVSYIDCDKVQSSYLAFGSAQMVYLTIYCSIQYIQVLKWFLKKTRFFVFVFDFFCFVLFFCFVFLLFHHLIFHWT